MKKEILHIIFFPLFFVLSMTVLSQEDYPQVSATMYTTNLGSEVYHAYTAEWGINGEFVAVATISGLYIYDAQLTLVASLYPNEVVRSISWNKQTSEFAIARLRSVEIWHFNPNTYELTLKYSFPLNGFITIVSFSPTTNYLMVAEANETNRGELQNDLPNYIKFFDTVTWQQVSQLQEWYYVVDLERDNHSNCDWNSDGTSVACFGEMRKLTVTMDRVDYLPRNIQVINPSTGLLIKSIPSLGASEEIAMSWQPNSNIVAVGDTVGVSLYNLNVDDYLDSFYMGYSPMSVEWSGDGRYLVSNTFIRDMQTGQIVVQYNDTGAFLSRWNPFKNQILNAYYVKDTGLYRITIDDVSLMPQVSLTLQPTATTIPATSTPILISPPTATPSPTPYFVMQNIFAEKGW